MNATSMEALERALMNHVRSAINSAASRADRIMRESLDSFYEGGTPTMYERTDALRNTSEVTQPKTDGKTISFEARLNDSHVYATGKKPTMTDVIELTNYGNQMSSVGYLAPAVGASGYLERAFDDVWKATQDALQSHFS